MFALTPRRPCRPLRPSSPRRPIMLHVQSNGLSVRQIRGGALFPNSLMASTGCGHTDNLHPRLRGRESLSTQGNNKKRGCRPDPPSGHLQKPQPGDPPPPQGKAADAQQWHAVPSENRAVPRVRRWRTRLAKACPGGTVGRGGGGHGGRGASRGIRRRATRRPRSRGAG